MFMGFPFLGVILPNIYSAGSETFHELAHTPHDLMCSESVLYPGRHITPNAGKSTWHGFGDSKLALLENHNSL